MLLVILQKLIRDVLSLKRVTKYSFAQAPWSLKNQLAGSGRILRPGIDVGPFHSLELGLEMKISF